MSVYWDRRMLAIFLWAFASGVPLLMILSTLAARLFEAGFTLKDIGFFGLAALPYSLKLLFSPFVEQLRLPGISRLFGRARSWMIVAMLGVMLSLWSMGSIDLAKPDTLMLIFWATLATCFCSSVSDIAEAEIRIELLNTDELGPGNACYNAGYQIGMLTGSAGTLILAQHVGWNTAYHIVASFMLIGIITVILKKHRARPNTQTIEAKETAQWLQRFNHSPRFLKIILEKIYLPIIAPMRHLTQHRGWVLLFLIVGFYLFSQEFMLNMLNPFLLSIGYTKTQIGLISGGFGTTVLVICGFASGLLIQRFGHNKILLISGFFQILTCLMLYALATHCANPAHNAQHHGLFIAYIVLQNMALGIGSSAFATLMSYYCRMPYTASQNAILTSVMAAAKASVILLSGYIATWLNWPTFFIIAALCMLPAFIFILRLQRVNNVV
tara:strand:+ start:64202 stop:65521 length:1320 start_codon:yes stop_codon:yes gene_type:complete